MRVYQNQWYRAAKPVDAQMVSAHNIVKASQLNGQESEVIEHAPKIKFPY